MICDRRMSTALPAGVDIWPTRRDWNVELTVRVDCFTAAALAVRGRVKGLLARLFPAEPRLEVIGDAHNWGLGLLLAPSGAISAKHFVVVVGHDRYPFLCDHLAAEAFLPASLRVIGLERAVSW